MKNYIDDLETFGQNNLSSSLAFPGNGFLPAGEAD